MAATHQELLEWVALHRRARGLAGRDPQGITPPVSEESETWVVSRVSPLMAYPLTGGPAVSVEATDGVKGVAVGMRIRVVVRGVGSRMAIALVDQVSIGERDTGEDVATVNGKQVTVGGSVDINANDVGALPEDTTLTDLGYTPPGPHQHSFYLSEENCRVTLPNPAFAWFEPAGAFDATWKADVDTLLRRMRDVLYNFKGATASCQNGGHAKGGSVSTGNGGGGSGPGGGGYTPPAPTRSVTIKTKKINWFEPGSTWSAQFAEDMRTLTWRARDAIVALSNSTHPVTTGGSITIQNLSAYYNDIWEIGGAGGFTRSWSQQTISNIVDLTDGIKLVCGSSRPVSSPGNGSITINAADPPAFSVTPQSTYSQPHTAALRLGLKRVFDAINRVSGETFG